MDQEGEDIDVQMENIEVLDIDLEEHDVLFGSENDMSTIKFSDRVKSLLT